MSATMGARRGEAGRPSLASQLERRRLDHRVERVRRVLAVLESRIDRRERDGDVPRTLLAVADSFKRELEVLERRRAELAFARGPRPRRRPG